MKPSRYNLLIGAIMILAGGLLLDRFHQRNPVGTTSSCCAVFPSPGYLSLAAEPITHDVVSEIPDVGGFFPEWVSKAKFNQPVLVRDTESAVGRLSAQPKEISLKNLARMHGHLCDGLVISYVELNAVLNRLFPDGVVDRTDLRVVSKNGPCWVDTASWLTGARINFQTLRVDASVGDGFIVQKISTGETWEVRLKPGVFPERQAALENRIRDQRAAGQAVDPADVDRFEAMANELIRRLLDTPADELLVVKLRPGYRFHFNDLYGERGDTINRDLRQSPNPGKN